MTQPAVNWTRRDLSEVDYVYWWADGIWFNVRLPDPDGNPRPVVLLVIWGSLPTVPRSWGTGAVGAGRHAGTALGAGVSPLRRPLPVPFLRELRTAGGPFH
ncbi:MAG: hypothetical protein ACRDXD_03575, partial [Acidimicrobiia bacterium]